MIAPYLNTLLFFLREKSKTSCFKRNTAYGIYLQKQCLCSTRIIQTHAVLVKQKANCKNVAHG